MRDEIDNSNVDLTITNDLENAAEQSKDGTFEHTAIGVMQGDCIVSLADEYGFWWETIWNHSDNHKVRSTRKNANILRPHDVVRVPAPEPKQEDGATESKHTFKLKTPPSVFRVKILVVWEAFANKPYKLRLNKEDPPIEGTTDAKGVIEVDIPPRQVWAELEVGDDLERYEYVLQMGHLDPIDSTPGVVARLNNVGYAAGPVWSFGTSNIIPSGMRRAVKQFQTDYGRRPTSVFDEKTRDKLHKLGI